MKRVLYWMFWLVVIPFLWVVVPCWANAAGIASGADFAANATYTCPDGTTMVRLCVSAGTATITQWGGVTVSVPISLDWYGSCPYHKIGSPTSFVIGAAAGLSAHYECLQW